MKLETAPYAENRSQSTSIQKRKLAEGFVRTAPVYNLSVEDGCYYANGILVSNCDALRYVVSNVKRKPKDFVTDGERKFKKKYSETVNGIRLIKSDSVSVTV